MLEDNKLTHGDISYIVYQQVFQSENTGFGKPSKDECDICAKYKAHCKDLDGAHDVDACEQCKGGQEHQKKTEEARTHYRENHNKKADNTSIFTVDVQKVILLPKMTPKEHFFVSRLVVFNETFASVKEDGDFVILWHKAISGRLGVDVASSYMKCEKLCEIDNLIFWAVNCSG